MTNPTTDTTTTATTTSPPAATANKINVMAGYVLPVLDAISYFFGAIWAFLFAAKTTPVQLGKGTDAVVISGASTGIGYDTAVTLAKSGVLVFAGVRAQKDLDALTGLNVSTLIPVKLDVANQDSIKNAVETVQAKLERTPGARLVGVINNAGVPAFGDAESVTTAEYHRVFDVNVLGPLHLTQAFLPLLRPHGGRVLLISSLAGAVTAPVNSLYSASKRAVEAIFDGFRQELGKEKIGVATIRPGAITTPIWTKFPTAEAKREVYYNAAQEMASSTSIPPSHVTRSIVHALTATYPCAIYSVGFDSRFVQVLVGNLPTYMLDYLTANGIEGV
ncbi:hypothetical protein BC828DRAFT_372866 [Blastocladiella britannica]|nr:hypothetical protein BC828DRAFT_372866 [Blastocladiella britannica]